jgi:hypothetical protein
MKNLIYSIVMKYRKQAAPVREPIVIDWEAREEQIISQRVWTQMGR